MLEAILALKPDTKVIVASGHGAHESMLRAIAMGAWDFYQKPIDIDALGLIVARAFHVHALEAENRRLAAREERGNALGGSSPARPRCSRSPARSSASPPPTFRSCCSARAAPAEELLARGLHEASGRKGAFVAINCAAIPETLLESELFGHEKGAFTGAVKTTEGKIEQAQGGTLFLDEIGDVPLPLQVKLLRFLQERVIERIGGRKPIPVDTRVVCATHQDIDGMVAANSFREDLYYRLAEIVVRIPSLAERPGDAGLLARHLLHKHATAMKLPAKSFAPDALDAIDAWHWPGNVRELENRVKRATIMADGKLVTAADLDLAPAEVAEPINLKAIREAADRRAIAHALARAEGNISGTARLLGISRPTLYDLMKAYDLQP
ncbi:sigma 54-interacting transcriptional regulator [Sphingomonas sp. J344]|uniref:sigma 54-interacting transcriptional regulator n=1 Tax=Sphingomonas sp. J344 TaxID=2898434 RepID=UPI002151C95B|nr:sigma 54-interacting transcriptional regulator [Sphingomonas sp. J344]MCR5869789.1 sigma 54-interacting transcriptional regulator [Sphingomonas sp. J344]